MYNKLIADSFNFQEPAKNMRGEDFDKKMKNRRY